MLGDREPVGLGARGPSRMTRTAEGTAPRRDPETAEKDTTGEGWWILTG